ncbi:MAG: PQQ-binding-like beta-propeller repeat protein, partial [Chitinispirillia bacterium]
KGNEVWRFEYDKGWNKEYPGVRATPAVVGDRLYIEGSYGRITCLNAKNGKEIWSVDMVKKFGAEIPRWGHTESMLVDNDYVYCTPGGPKTSIAALNRINGKTVWEKFIKKDVSGYCSPQIVRHGNAKLLVTMLGHSIIAVEPKNGKLLWQYPHPTEYGVNPNTPIYSNGKIIYFSGYGEGAVMLTLSPDGKSSQITWKNKKFDIQIGGAVLLGNLLFGSGHNNLGWHCLDIQTGKIRYTNKSIKRGCVISAEGLLYIYTERGTVELVKPGQETLTVISSFKITQGSREHWAHPVLSNGRLFIRHGGVMMVYNVKK